MLDLMILDTETTSDGTNEQAEPIQIAYSTASGIDADVFFRPNEKIMPCAAVIHGMDNAEVMLFDPIEEALPEFYEKFSELVTDDMVVVAYNAPFDIGILDHVFKKYLKKEFNPKLRLDILALAKKIVPVNETGNHRLDTVFYWLYPEKLKFLMEKRAKHSAAVDVEITEQVLMGLWEKTAELEKDPDMDLGGLLDYMQRATMLTVWPWGKHKGEPMEEVIKKDRQYVHWFMNQCDFRDDHPDLVFTIERLTDG